MWFLQRQLPDLALPQRGGQPSSLPTALVPQPSPRAPCGATLIHPEMCIQHQPTGAAPKDCLNFLSAHRGYSPAFLQQASRPRPTVFGPEYSNGFLSRVWVGQQLMVIEIAAGLFHLHITDQ